MFNNKSLPIEDFSFLKRRHAKAKIFFVLRGPDEEHDEIIFAARIRHAWLNSQHHRVVFDNGKRFDTQTRTVSGKPAYIFATTLKLIRRKRRKDGIRSILEDLGSIHDRGVIELADLVRGLAGENPRYATRLQDGWPMAAVSESARADLVAGLDSLSTPEIECLAALMTECSTANPKNAVQSVPNSMPRTIDGDGIRLIRVD